MRIPIYSTSEFLRIRLQVENQSSNDMLDRLESLPHTMPQTSADILPLNDTVEPADAAALAAAVRQAHADGLPLYPIGGGTSLDLACRRGNRAWAFRSRGWIV